MGILPDVTMIFQIFLSSQDQLLVILQYITHKILSKCLEMVYDNQFEVVWIILIFSALTDVSSCNDVSNSAYSYQNTSGTCSLVTLPNSNLIYSTQNR